MAIYADETKPVPRPIFIMVACDGDHGLFGAPSKTFPVEQVHPRDPPIKSGWKITPDGEALCPECA
jgi:hypothetical protein